MTGTSRRKFVKQAVLGGAALYGHHLAGLSNGGVVDGSGANAAPIDSAIVRKFAASIKGNVISSESPEYDARRVVFNRAFDKHPALIVRCAGVSDIGTTLEFAQRQNRLLAVRGGGHSRAGFGVCDGGVVIDLSGMNRVEVDAEKRVARAEAGSLVRDMDQATQRVGLATTMGGCPTVGIAGLTLGGGEGFLMSKYGAACDNLLSARLVTVDGREVEVSASSNTDLFWAIRGGGGNFGVVTSLQFRLHPVTDVLSGTMTYPPGQVLELLHAFAKFVKTAPDEMNVVGQVLPSEQGPRFHIIVCHCGEMGKGRDLLKQLRVLKPEKDTIRVASYLETQANINPYSSVAHFQTNVFVPELNDAVIATIGTATNNAPPNTRVFIVPLYGAVSRVGKTETAFSLRHPGYELDIMGRWTNPTEATNAVKWVQMVRDKLQPMAIGVYGNQLGETSEALVREACGANYARLVEIKNKYDPRNVLQINQNIRPS